VYGKELWVNPKPMIFYRHQDPAPNKEALGKIIANQFFPFENDEDRSIIDGKTSLRFPLKKKNSCMVLV
jgi:hypothetical protein